MKPHEIETGGVYARIVTVRPQRKPMRWTCTRRVLRISPAGVRYVLENHRGEYPPRTTSIERFARWAEWRQS